MRHLKILEQVTKREALSLDKYLREIGRIRLLTPDEEVHIVQKVKSGDHKALETLIISNLRFVVSVAKQYQNQELTLQDLISEGNLGLITAAGRFDETRGFKFISYAVWWIRQAILKALAEKTRIVRLPLNKVGQYNKIHKAFVNLEQEFQREPSTEEIAEMLNLNPLFVSEALSSTNPEQLITSEYDNENSEIPKFESTSSDNTYDSDIQLSKESLKIDIDRMLETLNARESEIIRYYYGLNGHRSHTLKEVGEDMQLTHERVRQIKENALRKLQNIKKKSLLKIYLG